MVRLGLAMPAMLPMRKTGGRGLWSIEEIHLLIELWSLNIHVDCIAARTGRSAGAVRSKARRPGLYRRNRRDLIKLWTSASKQPLAEGPPTKSVACADAGETAGSAGLANELAVPPKIEVVDTESDVPAARGHAVPPSIEATAVEQEAPAVTELAVASSIEVADVEQEAAAVTELAVPPSIEVANAEQEAPAVIELVLLASVEVADAGSDVTAATARGMREPEDKRRKATKPADQLS
jgi:hypothetical protein